MQFIVKYATLLHIDPRQIKAPIQEHAISSNTPRYGTSTLVKYKSPSKKLLFIVENRTLSHIDSCEV